MRQPKDTEPVLLSEIARESGLSRGTIYLMARARDIPVEFRAGRYEMQRADLERVVAELRRRDRGATAA